MTAYELSPEAKARVKQGGNAKERARLWQIEQDMAERAAKRKAKRARKAQHPAESYEDRLDDLGESFD